MSNKILKIVFVVLFLVVLGEVGYFFYYSHNQIVPSVDTTKTKITPIPTQRNGKEAINNETIEEMKNYNAGILKKSILQNTSSGKIVEIATNGINPKNNIHFAIKIKLVGDNDETNTFYYNDDEIKMIIINKTSDPINKNPLTINDLKEGDLITINEALDMTKDPDHNLVSNTISIQ